MLELERQIEKSDSTQTLSLLNLRPTPARLHISRNRVIQFSPFERRDFTDLRKDEIDLDALRFSGTIRQMPLAPPHAAWTLTAALIIWGALVAALLAFFLDWPAIVWLGLPVLVGLFLLFTDRHLDTGRARARRYLLQQVNLAAVVLVAVVLPGLVAWYVAGFSSSVHSLNDFHALLTAESGRTLAVAWILLWLFVVMATIIPALLYFLFDRTQLGTLKTELLWNIARLERELESLDDISAKYGRRIEETYGAEAATNARLAAGRRAPVLMATILLSLGWTALLLRHGLGSAGDPVPSDFRLIDAWEPPATLAAFAFLGAYVFGIRLALRGHIRGDLQPKTYSRISVRILVVVVMAWLLEVLIDPTAGAWKAAAFSIGVVPDEWLRGFLEVGRRLRQSLLGRHPSSADRSALMIDHAGEPDAIDAGERSSDSRGASWRTTESRGPGSLMLTNVEGIDLYDRVRLMDEGVNNVQALAKPDVVALLMRTRIPANRLLDWINQAVLMLRIGPPEAPCDPVKAARFLRALGVRGATEACAVIDSLDGPDPDITVEDEQCRQELLELKMSLDNDKTVTILKNWKQPFLSQATAVEEWAVPEVPTSLEVDAVEQAMNRAGAPAATR